MSAAREACPVGRVGAITFLNGRARVTVLHNGLLVQENSELSGPTAYKARPPYKAHPDKLPLGLQDHEYPVRYRNIWIRELAETEPPLPRD